MKLRLSVANGTILFGLITIVALAAAIMTGQRAVSQVKVGGPLYERIKLGNDLIADILPPPLYVIEAYLEATLALKDSDPNGAHRKRMQELRKDYDDRHGFWLKADIKPNIRSKIAAGTDVPAQQFWSNVDEMLSALSKHEQDAAIAAYDRASKAYASHRLAVDELVKLVTDSNTELETDGAQEVSSSSMLQLGIGILAFLIISAGLLAIGFGVIRPIVRMTARMKELADGDTQAAIPSVGRADEIGAMAAAMEVFKTRAVENEQLRHDQIRAEEEAAMAKKNAMLSMADTVERETGSSLEGVARATQDVNSAAQGLTRLAHDLSSESQAVAAASEQALANAETVSAAAEEMTASIREISVQVIKASEATRAAVESGNDARSTIGSLSAVVDKIADVTSLIGGIAGQTNLLALNATIEAARAGDAGRGFAVVASEVKSLSQQTAKSTEEISRLIAEVQAATRASVDAVATIGSRIGQIDEVASAVAAAMEEQGSATTEIARNVSQSAAAAREVSAKIANVSRNADSVNARSSDVREAIASVSSNLSTLQNVLVRVVRTSTDEANRRRLPRYPAALTIQVVAANGAAANAQLVDISEGGAHIACDPEMTIGERGTLKIAGLSQSIPFVVRGRDVEALHLAFSLTESQLVIYSDWFKRNFEAKAVAA